MNNTNNQIVAEDAQRNVARMSERDAEIVAAMTMAFQSGVVIGEARPRQDKEG